MGRERSENKDHILKFIGEGKVHSHRNSLCYQWRVIIFEVSPSSHTDGYCFKQTRRNFNHKKALNNVPCPADSSEISKPQTLIPQYWDDIQEDKQWASGGQSIMWVFLSTSVNIFTVTSSFRNTEVGFCFLEAFNLILSLTLQNLV